MFLWEERLHSATAGPAEPAGGPRPPHRERPPDAGPEIFALGPCVFALFFPGPFWEAANSPEAGPAWPRPGGGPARVGASQAPAQLLHGQSPVETVTEGMLRPPPSLAGGGRLAGERRRSAAPWARNARISNVFFERAAPANNDGL